MNTGLVFWSPGLSLDELEKQVILAAYKFHHNNKTATAASLKIAIRTLDNKLERYAEQEKAARDAKELEQMKRADFDRRQRGNPTPNHLGLPYEPYTPENARIDHDFYEKSTHDNHGLPRTAPLPNAPGDVLSTATRLHMESIANSAEKPALPLPEREEVQGVSSSSPAKGSHKRTR